MNQFNKDITNEDTFNSIFQIDTHSLSGTSSIQNFNSPLPYKEDITIENTSISVNLHSLSGIYVNLNFNSEDVINYNIYKSNMLGDTISLMVSNDYKERFIAEYLQLKIRIQKLEDILDNYKNNTLSFTPQCSYEILHEQLIIMKKYLDILIKRAKIEDISLD